MSAAEGGSPTPPDGDRSDKEQCPICGAPLRKDQDWCLHCGTAARTRLAPVPRWRRLVIALVVVGLLSLAGLTAALVKLSGGSSTSGSASGAAVSTPSAVSTSAPVTYATTTTTLAVTTTSAAIATTTAAIATTTAGIATTTAGTP